MGDKESWDQEKSLVLHEIKRLSEAVENLELRIATREHGHQEEHTRIREQLAVMKVRTGIIGSLSGAIATGIIIIGILLGTWVKSPDRQPAPTEIKK